MKNSRQSRLTRGLARRAQLLIVGGIALLVTGIFGIGSLLSRFAMARSNAEEEGTQAATPPGTFRPTDAQWENLKIGPVQLTSFQTEHTAEGKIANDDDATTPVFSPYSGRVTKLFARAGDSVKQGAPLLAVVASEFVQGQNDLISAAATLNTAHAQLDLARTNEKRQHELYDSKGGALKDWQQSKVDLATAEASFRSGEIALAAVRNRLRVLGKNDAEISAIENASDRQTYSLEDFFGPVLRQSDGYFFREILKLCDGNSCVIGHESPRTTKLYDRTKDEITLVGRGVVKTHERMGL